MIETDVAVAGGGISGLLIGSALSLQSSVLVLEQSDELPRNKYWVTDDKAGVENPELLSCIDRSYDYMDFVAYDGLTATVEGKYDLWDTDKLLHYLANALSENGGRILTGHRLYSISYEQDAILIRANSEIVRARLLVDCMGVGSPLVVAKNIAQMMGYYVLHGREIKVRGDIRPVGLDNVVLSANPAYFELFPASNERAHAALIIPSRHYRPERSIASEFNFILRKSHYSKYLDRQPESEGRSYFGVIPVGRLRQMALDRIVFFGEAGQANPAASATGLSRMLRTYKTVAASLNDCLRQDNLRRKELCLSLPRYMTPMNRAFQESLFESILSFDSEGFRSLVTEMRAYPSDVVSALIFADFDFSSKKTLSFVLDALGRRQSLFGRHVAATLLRLVARAITSNRD